MHSRSLGRYCRTLRLSRKLICIEIVLGSMIGFTKRITQNPLELNLPWSKRKIYNRYLHHDRSVSNLVGFQPMRLGHYMACHVANRTTRAIREGYRSYAKPLRQTAQKPARSEVVEWWAVVESSTRASKLITLGSLATEHLDAAEHPSQCKKLLRMRNYDS